MKKIFFIASMLLLAASHLMAAGALQGKFSVSETKQVRFAKGNLQYQPSSATWRFADRQWDVRGTGNMNPSETSTGWIDLFGWGTGDNPLNTSDVFTDYTTFAEWGNNTISNGGSAVNVWRTLTGEEWKYLFDTRTNAENLRGRATVNNAEGFVVLPDAWALPSGMSFTANPSDYTTNQYNASEWLTMEAAGALFLPAAGYRYGAYQVSAIGSSGAYWSSTPDDIYAFQLYFNASTCNAKYGADPSFGWSVRLVTENLADVGHTVTFKDHDGTVLKEEIVTDGDAAHAPDKTPTREGYTFTGWSPADFSNVTDDMTITAQYEINKYTVTFCGVNESTVVKTYTDVEHGSAVTPPEPKDDYESLDFVEWASDAYKNVTSNLTILGVYKPKTFTVRFEDQWGNFLGNVEVAYGQDANPTANGIDIADKECWEQNGFSSSWQTITSSKTIVVQYLQKEYTVTFKGWKDGDAAAVLKTGKVGCGDAATAPEVPAREDYTFTGWDTDFSEVKGELTVTAQYEINKYYVTIVSEHGTVTAKDADNNDVDLSQKVAHGTVLTLTATPDEGYEFDSWTNYDPATGLTVTGDITVTAAFKEKKATGIESVDAASTKAQKVLRDGKLYILTPDGRTYNALGAEVR